MRKRHEAGGESQAASNLDQEVCSEERLVNAARAGAPGAWRELFQCYFPKIYRYVYCRIGDRAAAEDITAQVFLEAWKGIKSFKYRGVPISAWLYRIAHNLSADFLRRRNRIRFEPLSKETPNTQLAGDDHEEAIAARQEMVDALRRLTPEQQQVVVMRFVEGMSRAAVAAAIGKSEEAVKALQHRALKSLRKQLEKTRNQEEA